MWKNNIHPELIRRVGHLQSIAKSESFDIRVVSGFRSHAEQTKLYNKGRTTKGSKVTNAKAGQSFHNFGLAVDLAPFIDGAICWDEKKFNWSLIGKWATAAGLEWGGDWHTFKDRPHVQLIGDLTTMKAQSLYAQNNDLSKVWEYVAQKTSALKSTSVVNKTDDLAKVQILAENIKIPAAENVANSTPQIFEESSANPQSFQPPEQNDTSVKSETILQTVETYGDTIQKTTEKITNIQTSVSPISKASWFMTLSAKTAGFFLLIYGWAKDNWFELLIALGLIALAVFVYSKAKDRAVSKTLNTKP